MSQNGINKIKIKFPTSIIRSTLSSQFTVTNFSYQQIREILDLFRKFIEQEEKYYHYLQKTQNINIMINLAVLDRLKVRIE